MPVTKYRGHSTVSDPIFQVSHQFSSIAAENNPAVTGNTVNVEASSPSVSQFLDQHTGNAQLACSITGTGVATGDVVQAVLTPGNGSGAVTVSYTASAGDSGQATLPLKLQAVATGLVNAINASAAVTGGTAFLQTVGAPSNAAFTLVSNATNGSVTLQNNLASTSTPGTAGHAILTPPGATNNFVPQNANLHLPTNDAILALQTVPNVTQLVTLTGGEPILLDPVVFSAASNQGVVFTY